MNQDFTYTNTNSTRYRHINSQKELDMGNENTFGNVSSMYNENKIRKTLLDQVWENADTQVVLLSNTKALKLKLLPNNQIRVITDGLNNFETECVVCAGGVFGTPELLVASEIIPKSTIFTFFDRPRLAFMYRFPNKTIWDNTQNEGFNFYYLNRASNEIYEYMIRSPYNFQSALELIGEPTNNIFSKLGGVFALVGVALVRMSTLPLHIITSINKHIPLLSNFLNVTINPMFDTSTNKFEIKKNNNRYYPHITQWDHGNNSDTKEFYKKAIKRFMDNEHKNLKKAGATPVFDENYRLREEDIQTHWHYGGSMTDHINDKCRVKHLEHKVYVCDMGIAHANNRANTHGLAHLCGNMAAECYLES